jgi:putative transposase
LLKIVYLLTCRVLGLAILVFRSDLAKDAELLVLRHENVVLRRHAGRIRYEPGRPGLVHRAWFTALARLEPQALGRSLPRDASDAAGLAPQAGGEEVRHEQTAPARRRA